MTDTIRKRTCTAININFNPGVLRKANTNRGALSLPAYVIKLIRDEDERIQLADTERHSLMNKE